MNNKRVFILGAGSSKSNYPSFPSINEFFKIAKNIGILKRQNDNYLELEDYIKTWFGVDIFLDDACIDVELLFTNIEIQIERNPTWHLLEIKNKLLKLIIDLLINLEGQSTINKDYNSFYSNIKQTDTIITFNWDLLLDNICERKKYLSAVYQSDEKTDFLDEKNHYGRFLLDFTCFGEGTWKRISIDRPYKTWDSGNGYYLKLHGSVDWFYCKNNQCRAWGKLFPVLSPCDPVHPYICSECHENLDTLIIPPILNKEYNNFPSIRKIWSVAARELSISKELIIWGYSIPPTDFYTDWLIRHSRYNIEKISIIDPKVIDSNHKYNGSFIKRYYEIFKDKVAPDKFSFYEYYNDYESNDDVSKKYKLSATDLSNAIS
mgnify:FL=1